MLSETGYSHAYMDLNQYVHMVDTRFDCMLVAACANPCSATTSRSPYPMYFVSPLALFPHLVLCHTLLEMTTDSKP